MEQLLAIPMGLIGFAAFCGGVGFIWEGIAEGDLVPFCLGFLMLGVASLAGIIVVFVLT